MCLFFALKCIFTSVGIHVFLLQAKADTVASPSLPKLRLLMPKVVATTSAEALCCLLAMMVMREWPAKEEIPTEPRQPKTKPRRALLTVQLARCEGRGRVTVHLL